MQQRSLEGCKRSESCSGVFAQVQGSFAEVKIMSSSGDHLRTTRVTEAMADALKDEGNRLMKENKPVEAIAKYCTTVQFSRLLMFCFCWPFAFLRDSRLVTPALACTPRPWISLALHTFCCPTGVPHMRKRVTGRRLLMTQKHASASTKNSTRVRATVLFFVLPYNVMTNNFSKLLGYARKIGALMGMKKYKEASKVCKVRLPTEHDARTDAGFKYPACFYLVRGWHPKYVAI